MAAVAQVHGDMVDKHSILRGSGDKVQLGNLLPVFVHGAYNLGAIIVRKELVTTAIHPGEGLDWGTGAGGEDSVTIMAAASTTVCGVGEWDPGMIAGCSTDYALLSDDIPVIMFHWNPGAMLRNIQYEDPTAALGMGDLVSTNSGTAGSFDDTVGGGCAPMRLAKYHADAGAAQLVVAWIHGQNQLL